MTTWKEVNDIYKKHENMRNRLYSVFSSQAVSKLLTRGNPRIKEEEIKC